MKKELLNQDIEKLHPGNFLYEQIWGLSGLQKNIQIREQVRISVGEIHKTITSLQ